MIYTSYYNSPIGKLLLASKDNKLIGVWIQGQKYYLGKLKDEIKEQNLEEILIKTKKWLDRYFNQENPNISELDLAPIGAEFRQRVWNILCKIPYGKTITYGEIAKQIAKDMGRKRMSSQAIGGAVSHNPISIIIPCHRVIGKGGNLIGYAGGVDIKVKLLKLENANMEKLNLANMK